MSIPSTTQDADALISALNTILKRDIPSEFRAVILDIGTVVRYMRGQIANLEADNTWQPISTAPRDGTPIIVWSDHKIGPGEPIIVVPHIDNGDDSTWQCLGAPFWYGIRAKRWRPCPTRPVIEESGA